MHLLWVVITVPSLLLSETYLDDVGLLKNKPSHLTPHTTSLQRFFVTLIDLMWQAAKHNFQGIRKQFLKCSLCLLN